MNYDGCKRKFSIPDYKARLENDIKNNEKLAKK